MEGALAVFLGFLFVSVLALMAYTVVTSFFVGRNGAKTMNRQKTFRTLKKGSEFIHNGKRAVKTDDNNYNYVGSNDSFAWDFNNLMLLHILTEPSHSFETHSHTDHHHYHGGDDYGSSSDDGGSSDSGGGDSGGGDGGGGGD